MKPRMILRNMLAYTFAVICLLSSRMLVERQDFTAVLHFQGNRAPNFGQARTFMEQSRDSDQNGAIAMSAWAQGETLQISGEGAYTASVDSIYVMGDASRAGPEMIIGLMPGIGQRGVALDETVAANLFGSTSVLGQQVNIDGGTYTVCGVFACPKGLLAWGSTPARGLIVLSPPMDAKVQSLGLLLAVSSEETLQRVDTLTSSIGVPYHVENREVAALLIRQLGWLPLWRWAVMALCRLGKSVWSCVRRPTALNPRTVALPQRLRDIASRVLISAIYLSVCIGLLYLVEFAPKIPVAWLPTRWSDLGHWGQLVKRLGEDWASLQTLPTLRTELPRLSLLGSLVASCISALILGRQKSTDSSCKGVIIAALMPIPSLLAAYLLGCRLAFIPALVLFPILSEIIGYVCAKAQIRSSS